MAFHYEVLHPLYSGLSVIIDMKGRGRTAFWQAYEGLRGHNCCLLHSGKIRGIQAQIFQFFKMGLKRGRGWLLKWKARGRMVFWQVYEGLRGHSRQVDQLLDWLDSQLDSKDWLKKLPWNAASKRLWLKRLTWSPAWRPALLKRPTQKDK
jgi:hypothetical protein